MIPTAASVASTTPFTHPDYARILSASGATSVIFHQLQEIYSLPSLYSHLAAFPAQFCVNGVAYLNLTSNPELQMDRDPGTPLHLPTHRLSFVWLFLISSFPYNLDICCPRVFHNKELWAVDIATNTLKHTDIYFVNISIFTSLAHLAHSPLAHFSPLYCRPGWLTIFSH